MELKVIKRAKDLTPGAFKIGTVVDLDTDDMVVYHKGLEWNVRKTDDGYYTMGNSETVFEVVV
jgi:hypothetical protein|nr:MAG: hypothetical protein [Bacteriophage sp.]UWI24526.1 MAG: hypothetical protein [Bacteriophage sp.]